MSAHVYSVPGQAEELFGMETMNYLLHEIVMLIVIKVFIILFLLVRIGNILAIFIINQ